MDYININVNNGTINLKKKIFEPSVHEISEDGCEFLPPEYYIPNP